MKKNNVVELQNSSDRLINSGYENILFLDPGYSLRGAPLNEIRLANYLCENTQLNIYVCDFKDGYLKSLIKNTNIKFIEYKYNNTTIPDKTIIFTSSTRIILIPNQCVDNKILLWHNESLKCRWDLVFNNGEEKKFLRLINSTNSVCFHDWSSYFSLSNSLKEVIKYKKNYYLISILDDQIVNNKKLICNYSELLNGFT